MHLGLEAVVALVARIVLDPPAPGELVGLGVGGRRQRRGLEKLRAEGRRDLAPRAVGLIAFAIPELANLGADLRRRGRPVEVAEAVVARRLQFELPGPGDRDLRF
jgi:hypothetical protein